MVHVPTLPGATALQYGGGRKDEDLMQRVTRKVQQEFPHLLQEDDNDDDHDEQKCSNDRVGPLVVPAHPTPPRKSGRSRGLAERDDSESHSQPSSQHNMSNPPISCSTPTSNGSSTHQSSSVQQQQQQVQVPLSLCGTCSQPSSDRWLACDNLESPPHLVCKRCVRQYLIQAPSTGAPFDLPDKNNHLCRIPCLHNNNNKNKPCCRGVVHVNAATVLDFAEMDTLFP